VLTLLVGHWEDLLMRFWRGCLSGVRCKWFCIWSSWCHCHLLICWFIRIQLVYLSGTSYYSGRPGNEAIKRVLLLLLFLTVSN